MSNTSYIGLSNQIALKQMMDLTANNIANMTTTGYKSQGLLFHQYMTRGFDEGPVTQVQDYGTFRRMEIGPLQQTYNPLDFALQGDAYFVVDTPQGERYTRAGNFVLNEQGEIVTQQGFPVRSTAGTPITIPETDSQISTTADGVVSTESGEQGRFEIVTFENDQTLREMGDNLYAGNGETPTPAENTKIMQGTLESSNVQPIVEMSRMIEILRMYQSAQRLSKDDHDMQRTMIQRLSRVG